MTFWLSTPHALLIMIQLPVPTLTEGSFFSTCTTLNPQDDAYSGFSSCRRRASDSIISSAQLLSCSKDSEIVRISDYLPICLNRLVASDTISRRLRESSASPSILSSKPRKDEVRWSKHARRNLVSVGMKSGGFTSWAR